MSKHTRKRKHTVTAIHSDSGKVEWYTPPFILTAARMTMGAIDLDPASCEAANMQVGATRYYTMADDGLTSPWYGRVWLNHPFGVVSNRQWAARLVDMLPYVDQLCTISFASTSEPWFQTRLKAAAAICLLAGRTSYVDGNGDDIEGSPSKGSAVMYYGPRVLRFKRFFDPYGDVWVPLR